MRVLLFLSNNLSTRLLVYLLTKETTRQLVNSSTEFTNPFEAHFSERQR